MPGVSLHARQSLGERDKPEARSRAAALMQRGDAIFGRFGKQLGCGGKVFDTGTEDQQQRAQPLRADGRGDSGGSRQVDRL